MPLLIRGGRLIDPADGVDEICDILIEEGQGRPPEEEHPAARGG